MKLDSNKGVVGIAAVAFGLWVLYVLCLLVLVAGAAVWLWNHV